MSNRIFYIEITQEEMQILSVALVELPYKTVAPLIGKINQQVNAALQAGIIKDAK